MLAYLTEKPVRPKATLSATVVSEAPVEISMAGSAVIDVSAVAALDTIAPLDAAAEIEVDAVADLGGPVPSSWIGGRIFNAADGTIAWPDGTDPGDSDAVAAGDIALVVASGQGTEALAGAGWSAPIALGTVQGGFDATAWWKVLTQADIDTPPAFSGAINGGFSAYVWRGASSLSLRTVITADAGADCAIPGFIKSADSSRVAALLVDRDPTGTPTAPTGFVLRKTGTTTFLTFAVSDIAGPDYDDGVMTWTTLATANTQLGASFELI